MNRTPFVIQYDVLNNEWGVFLWPGGISNGAIKASILPLRECGAAIAEKAIHGCLYFF